MRIEILTSCNLFKSGLLLFDRPDPTSDRSNCWVVNTFDKPLFSFQPLRFFFADKILQKKLHEICVEVTLVCVVLEIVRRYYCQDEVQQDYRHECKWNSVYIQHNFVVVQNILKFVSASEQLKNSKKRISNRFELKLIQSK